MYVLRKIVFSTDCTKFHFNIIQQNKASSEFLLLNVYE